MPHLRVLALAGALLAGPALHAQQDSLAPAQPVGVRVDSIVPGTAERAAAATLGELLRGRAAGLNVAESSGSLGAAPRMWVRGVSSLILETRPLVVVDGVPTRAWADTLLGGLASPTSAVDLLSASEIASVRVLHGPAATAAYGPEGAAGVLEVRTVAADAHDARGGLRLEGWSALSARSDAGRYPLRYRRPGISSSGAAVQTCPADAELLGSCTPLRAAPDVTDPMADADPYRTGTGFSGGANVRGGAFDGRVGYGVQVVAEDADGAHPQNRRRQRAASAAARARLPGGAVLDLGAAASRRALVLPMEANSVLATSARVLLYAEGQPQEFGAENTEDADWVRLRAALDWPVARWLSLGGRWSRHDAETEARQESRAGSGHFRVQGDLTRERDEWQVHASTRGSVAGASGVLTAGVGRTGEALERVTRITNLGGGTSAEQRATRTVEAEHALARGSVRAGGFVLGGALRRDRLSAFEPAETRDAYSLGGEWAVPVAGAGRWLDGLRLRAAHGRTERGVEMAEVPALLVCGPGGCDAVDPERLTESEAGVDLSAFGALELGVSAYRRRTDDLLAVVGASPSQGFYSTVANVGSMRYRGVEAAAALGGTAWSAAWRVEARQSWNRNRVDVPGRGAVGAVSYLAHRDGYPAGSLFGYRYTWQDRDGNGLLRGVCSAPQACEIQRSAEVEFLGTSVPERVGSALGSVRVGVLRVHALADWQGGARRYDAAGSLYCSGANCEASYLRGEAMEEQARIYGGSLNADWVHDAGFVRLREVSLTLAAPARLLRGLSRGVDLTLAGRNLAVWTSYPGFDPETAGTGASPFAWRGLFEQPPLRTVTTRIDVRF